MAGLQIYNRGISGHKVFQLAERWDADCMSLKPDVVSILIGVNDIWHRLNGQYNGTVEVYEKDYRAPPGADAAGAATGETGGL